jgi:hypothetical protein
MAGARNSIEHAAVTTLLLGNLQATRADLDMPHVRKSDIMTEFRTRKLALARSER